MTAVQGDLLDLLDGRPTEGATDPWQCPACGSTWPDPQLCTGGRAGLIDWHTNGNPVSAETTAFFELGDCLTQRIKIEFIHLRRLPDDVTHIRWDRHTDLLAEILEARQSGCTEAAIRTVLDMPWEDPC